MTRKIPEKDSQTLNVVCDAAMNNQLAAMSVYDNQLKRETTLLCVVLVDPDNPDMRQVHPVAELFQDDPYQRFTPPPQTNIRSGNTEEGLRRAGAENSQPPRLKH